MYVTGAAYEKLTKYELNQVAAAAESVASQYDYIEKLDFLRAVKTFYQKARITSALLWPCGNDITKIKEKHNVPTSRRYNRNKNR